MKNLQPGTSWSLKVNATAPLAVATAQRWADQKEEHMGLDDKIGNKAEDLKGRAKEAAGSLTDDEDLKAEGEADQTKAGIKDKVENVKDKIQDKVDDIL